MKYSAIPCNTLQCTIEYNAIKFNTFQYPMKYCAIRCNTLQCTMKYNAIHIFCLRQKKRSIDFIIIYTGQSAKHFKNKKRIVLISLSAIRQEIIGGTAVPL